MLCKNGKNWGRCSIYIEIKIRVRIGALFLLKNFKKVFQNWIFVVQIRCNWNQFLFQVQLPRRGVISETPTFASLFKEGILKNLLILLKTVSQLHWWPIPSMYSGFTFSTIKIQKSRSFILKILWILKLKMDIGHSKSFTAFELQFHHEKKFGKLRRICRINLQMERDCDKSKTESSWMAFITIILGPGKRWWGIHIYVWYTYILTPNNELSHLLNSTIRNLLLQ